MAAPAMAGGKTAKRRRRRRSAFQIKRPGALTAQQKPGESMSQTANRVSSSGTGLQQKQANFYKNVLAPANAARRRRGKKG